MDWRIDMRHPSYGIQPRLYYPKWSLINTPKVTFATLKTNALIDTSEAVPFVDSMIALTLTMNVLTTGTSFHYKCDRHRTRKLTLTMAYRVDRIQNMVCQTAKPYD